MTASKPRPRIRACLRLVVVLGSVALLGCQAIPQTLAGIPGLGEIVAPPLPPTAELPPPAARAWPDPAQDVITQRARGYGLARMPQLQLYLNGLLAHIKTSAGVPDWPGEVHILATSTLEAYATAAGNIYVSPSWAAEAQTEDELVALLAHEFAHVYLHYHQLEGAVQSSDQLATLAAVGVALARKTGQSTGWNQVDTLVTSYMMGRTLTAASWGRGQESAADAFAMNLSFKMGYGYEHGMKVLLERLASWEETNSERQRALSQQLLAELQKQSHDAVMNEPGKDRSSPLAQAMFQPLAGINAGINTLLFQGQEAAKGIANATTSTHPQILARLDAVAKSVEPLPEALTSREPVTAPLEKALRDKQTASLLKNYELAAQVLADPSAPDALRLARQAASGLSARHAFPLMAVYRAELAQPPATGKRARKADPGAVLDANLGSAPDRAWMLYLERSNQLEASGQRKDAIQVMDQGFAHFEASASIWPQAIAFYGQTQGWAQAQALAQSCRERFGSLAPETTACNTAAATPEERAAAQRKTDEKADQLVKKLFNKN